MTLSRVLVLLEYDFILEKELKKKVFFCDSVIKRFDK